MMPDRDLFGQPTEPPIANVETEAALIAAILIDNQQIDRVADIVRAEDFFESFYRDVFELAVQERNLGNAVSVLSLRRAVGDEKAQMLVGLTSGSGAVLIGAVDFAHEIAELGRLRRIVGGLEAIVAHAKETGAGKGATAEEVVAEAETVLSASLDTRDGAKSITAGEAIAALVENLGKDEPGVTSGIVALDHTLGPIRKHDLTILGGRPGMGKSAVASSYSLGAAAKGHGVLFISREMSAEDLAERMAADLCFDGDLQVPYSAVTSRQLTNVQAREVARAADRIRDLPLVIEDKRGKTLGSINALVRRHKRRFAARDQRLDLVVVDYLQLVSPDQREKDIYTRITEVSKGLKDCAKTNGVAVMALCQLSRAVEQRQDKRPIMADLRDSGQIEQDADAILFLYSPEYYLRQSEPSDERDRLLADCRGRIEFIVPKRRRGPGGTGYGRFYRDFQAVRG
jgi:replicative DNA helicase